MLDEATTLDTVTAYNRCSFDPHKIRCIQQEFQRYYQRSGDYHIVRGNTNIVVIYEPAAEAAAWAEVDKIAPSNEELRASVVRFRPPPEWLEEDQAGLY